MGFITYKQADSRWGGKNYNGSSTMATAGCGPTSCAMLLYGIDGTITPLDTMKYMQTHGDEKHSSFAIRNQGTAWNGITQCLKYFGAEDVKILYKMKDVFSYFGKGYVGIFRFQAGKRGGITWTTSGHYIAVTDYKIQNGNHYFYTRDSGGRNNTGWYCYETKMKGLLQDPAIWVCKINEKNPFVKPTTKYEGNIPEPTIKPGADINKVKNWQKFLNWYCQGRYNLKIDGKFGSNTKTATEFFQSQEGLSNDGIAGKSTIAKAKTYLKQKIYIPEPYQDSFPDFVTHSRNYVQQIAKNLAWAKGTPSSKYKYSGGSATDNFKKALNKVFPNRSSWGAKAKAGASCDVFVATVMRYSGCDTDWKRGLDGQYGKIPKHCMTTSNIKEAQMLIYEGHTRMIVDINGAKYNCEANHNKNGGQYGHIGSKASKPSKKNLKMFRVTSAFRNFLAKGDEGSEVIKWQKFLKWYGYDCKADGNYGDKTEGFTKTFQNNNGLTVDGKVGTKTIERAKTIKK